MKPAIVAIAILLFAAASPAAAPTPAPLKGRTKINVFPFINCEDAMLAKAARLDSERLQAVAAKTLKAAELEMIDAPDIEGVMLGANVVAEKTEDGYAGTVLTRAFVVQETAAGFDSVVVWASPPIEAAGATPQQLSTQLDRALVETIEQFIAQWAEEQE